MTRYSMEFKGRKRGNYPRQVNKQTCNEFKIRCIFICQVMVNVKNVPKTKDDFSKTKDLRQPVENYFISLLPWKQYQFSLKSNKYRPKYVIETNHAARFLRMSKI